MNGMMRTIGRIAAVGAVALLLVGTTAGPVGAMRRSEAQAIKRANAFVNRCLAAGGDPAAEHGMTGNGGVWSVICDYPNGESLFLMFPYDDPGYEPPEWERVAPRSASGGESALTADERGPDAAEAADHGKPKAHKSDKHKQKHQRHTSKHGRR
jgi:hypothetical protein